MCALRLSFDDSRPEELEKARKIIVDMLRRGYTVIAHTPDGDIHVCGFDPDTRKYIVDRSASAEEQEQCERLSPWYAAAS